MGASKPSFVAVALWVLLGSLLYGAGASEGSLFYGADASNITVVGGDQGWTFGFNYTDWALKSGPFYLGDTLVFKYDPPNGTNHPHSVYLLRDLNSFQSCDLKRALLVGNVMQGGGKGFYFTLGLRTTHYFVCGEKQGFHCNQGLMKFSIKPLKRPCHH
ncbi:hypothetical protein AMTRI_Chr01g112630 [Amborella trichopoda]|uniref:Phytocyanin domain-containing protein n=1 Tax=Amborella trichopoda TaxID=13333 RepID=W1PG42_AMBTC|nr:uncharacterized protein LOC18434853 [Amborella trichopoda]ERN06654.1 hypothetical protein AMTR_s00058p00186140 [Amborella trichopoda]|eukprot:XP_006844979.1 uncharacterized protein LOC18434853 [Amborella trichopoda]